MSFTSRCEERDEHRTVTSVLVAAVAVGLLLTVLPREADVVHAFEHGLGFMAPTCGLTRAGLALLRGDLATAWAYNPAIFLVAPLMAALLARFVAGVATGRWLNVRLRAGRIGQLAGAAFVVVLWLNQQAHFALLAK